MPLISIVMSVYNTSSEKVLERSINSILRQSFSDFEFIICNDCSTSPFVFEVLNKMKNKDRRIILLENKENRGLAFSLNKCISFAKGKYIGRQDDDDISLPNRLTEEVQFLEEHPKYGFVGTSIYLFDDKRIFGKQLLKQEPKVDDLAFGPCFAHPTLLLRKEAIDKVNGYTVSKETRRTEDYDLYFKLMFNNVYGYNLQACLFLYYQSYNNEKKQKLKYRFDEYKLKKKWFPKIRISKRLYFYLLKPFVSGLIPLKLKHRLKVRKFRLSSEEEKYLNENYDKFIFS
jgi:glycosyltransferase EpsE